VRSTQVRRAVRPKRVPQDGARRRVPKSSGCATSGPPRSAPTPRWGRPAGQWTTALYGGSIQDGVRT
jgi:hypothetical protein